MDPTNEDVLGKWSVFVLKELERHNDDIRKMQEDIGQLKVDVGQITRVTQSMEQEISTLVRNGGMQKVDIAVNRVKSGIFGVIGGCLPALAALLYWILKKG